MMDGSGVMKRDEWSHRRAAAPPRRLTAVGAETALRPVSAFVLISSFYSNRKLSAEACGSSPAETQTSNRHKNPPQIFLHRRLPQTAENFTFTVAGVQDFVTVSN